MESNQNAPALEELHGNFVEAFRANDPQALSGFFSESAVLLPPARPIVSGRDNVVGFWQNAQRIQDIQFEATEVELLSDTVLREAGNLQIGMRGQGRDTRSTSSKYVALWLNVGGAWKIDSLIWNSAGGAGQQGGQQRMGAGQGGGGQGRGAGAGGGYGQGAGGARQGRMGGGQGGGGGGQGAGGYGQGGAGRRRQGGGQGGGGQGGQGGGYGQGGRGQQGGGGGGYGGGRPGAGAGGPRRGGGGGGFGGPRGGQRADPDAPLVPRVDD